MGLGTFANSYIGFGCEAPRHAGWCRWMEFYWTIAEPRVKLNAKTFLQQFFGTEMAQLLP